MFRVFRPIKGLEYYITTGDYVRFVYVYCILIDFENFQAVIRFDNNDDFPELKLFLFIILVPLKQIFWCSYLCSNDNYFDTGLELCAKLLRK